MNKRSFIKLFSGIVAAPVVSPLMKLLPDIKLKNWSGNFEYGTENSYTANSLQQGRDFVSKQAKLKVLGTRHCFNKIADSDKQFLSMKPAEELFPVNEQERTVTVDGNMTYGHLCPLLHEKGFALHNLDVAASHFHCRLLQHCDPWLGRQERKPGNGGVGSGTYHRQRRFD